MKGVLRRGGGKNEGKGLIPFLFPPLDPEYRRNSERLAREIEQGIAQGAENFRENSRNLMDRLRGIDRSGMKEGTYASEAADAEEKADENDNAGTQSATCSTGDCGEEPPEDDEQDGKDAKRMSDKRLDKAAKRNGYRDAHHLKEDFQLDSRSDIFADRNGNMWAGPRKGTGAMERLGININGT